MLPVSPVLKVEGTIDGKKEAIGLDTFGGTSMVEEEVVLDRKKSGKSPMYYYRQWQKNW